jgi:hypothetical protein
MGKTSDGMTAKELLIRIDERLGAVVNRVDAHDGDIHQLEKSRTKQGERLGWVTGFLSAAWAALITMGAVLLRFVLQK